MNREFKFAEVLRSLMDRHPLTGEKTTQRNLAKIIEIRPQTLSLYWHGETQPSPDKLLKMADYFGVSVDYMLTGCDNAEGDEVTRNIWKQEFYETASQIAVLCSQAENKALNLTSKAEVKDETEVEQ